MKRISKASLAVILALSLCGCASKNPTSAQVANIQPTTAYGTAAKIGYDVQAVIHQSAQSADQLRSNGTISVADERVGENFLLALTKLNGSFEVCVETAHTQSSTAVGYISCANAFSTGVKDPNFLATIRVVNKNSQDTFNQWALLVQNLINAGINALTTLKSGGN